MMNDCLTREQILACLSARGLTDAEPWSHITQCGECHRRIAEMTGVAWLAVSLEAFQAGAVDGVPHDAVQRVFDQLRLLYAQEVAPPQNCPDDDALLALALGGEAAAAETRRHVQQCGSCQKAVAQLQALHRFVTDYEIFLSTPHETMPDPAARRIFDNANAVFQTENSVTAEHPNWAWLLSMLAGTVEPAADVRTHVAPCTECRAFLSKLLGTVHFAGAIEAFAEDREREMPLATANRIFERVHAEYLHNVAALTHTRARLAAGTGAQQPLTLDENPAGSVPSVAGQWVGRSGLWRRLLPYASAASLLLALGIHGLKGSLNRVGDPASATQAIVGSDTAATAGGQHRGQPPNGTAPDPQPDQIVRSTPKRGSAVLPTGKDKTAIDMAIHLRAAANIACVGPEGNAKVQQIADRLREVDRLGPVPAPFQPLYHKLSELVARARHGELSDLDQTAERNEAVMREWLRLFAAGITRIVLTQREGADSDLRTRSLDQKPEIHASFQMRLESLIDVLAALANPAKWSNWLNAHPAGSYDLDGSRPQNGQSSSKDRQVLQADLSCVTEAVVGSSISVG